MRIEILKTLSVLHPDHDIVEVRTKWASGNMMIGRTRSHEAIAEWASLCGGEPSIFVTINRLPSGMVESPLNGNVSDAGGGVKRGSGRDRLGPEVKAAQERGGASASPVRGNFL